MKTILNKFKLVILLLCVITYSSCEDDDLGPENFLVTGDAFEDVNVTIDLGRTVSAEDDALPASVTLSRTFDVDANVVIETRFPNGRSSLSTITVPTGSTSGSGFIATPLDDGSPANPVFFEDFTVIGTSTAVSIGADDGNGVLYLAVSNDAEFRVINGFPSTLGLGGISMTLTWDSDDDYDIFYDNSGNQGATGNRLEFIELGNDEVSGDGVQPVTIDPFSIEGLVDVPFILAIRQSNPFSDDIITILEGTFDTTDTAPFTVAEITRTSTVDNSNPDNPITNFDYSIVQIED